MAYAVYGIGGFGREVAPLAVEAAKRDGAGDVVFVDDAGPADARCNGLPVLDFDQLCSPQHRQRQVIIAIGDGKLREKIELKCRQAGLIIGNLVAPTARLLHDCRLGEGHVLCDQTILTANIVIGRSFQSNLASYIGHDCVIGDYVTFAPRVNCNGNVHIENYAYIGTGAFLRQGTAKKPLRIGEGAVVGMAAVVTKDVEPYTVVAGNPARAIRQLKA
jgi:sugar O-acyltransferase (sialic acid O-acetyltransferase NeuD family)